MTFTDAVIIIGTLVIIVIIISGGVVTYIHTHKKSLDTTMLYIRGTKQGYSSEEQEREGSNMIDRVGQKLGSYQLLRLLGQGGYADVYLGKHLHLGTQAAIKILNVHITSKELGNFTQEAKTIANLKHPNIVRVLDFGVENSVPFLVMDYARHGTLRDKFKGPQALAIILPSIKQVTAALQYVHNQKLIHRDIKPENMLLDDNNHVLLSDFGIVAVAHSTRTRVIQDKVGTLQYMAPEQIKGYPVVASDQYALGIVVYEWLCGTLPFDGSDIETIVAQHLQVPPPSLRSKLSTIPVRVEQVVLKALAKEPDQRFTSVLDFANALEQAQQGYPIIESVDGVASSKGKLLCKYQGHTESIRAVAWSPDGKYLVSGSWDKTVQVWEAATGREVFTYRGHNDRVNTVTWSPNGKYIASGSDDCTIRVRNALTREKVCKYTGHSDCVNALAWSPDSTRIASASDDESVQIWEASTGNQLVSYDEHEEDSDIEPCYVLAVAWSPDGRYIASASDENVVRIWESATGNDLFSYERHDDRINAVAWSPDGRYIASGSGDRSIRVRDVATRKGICRYRGHSDWVRALAWSPDATSIASASDDGTVRIWEAMTKRDIFVYRGHSDYVNAVAWSPDGKLIASGSDDCTVQVWQAI